MARDDEGSQSRGEEGNMYIETKTEIEKPSIVENLVTGNLEIAKSILNNIKLGTKIMRDCIDVLIYDIQLKVANIENVISARENIKIVDESILFRSLGVAK
jgi:hypothetical protein